MSWDAWAQPLVHGNKNSEAAIIALNGSSVWGKAGGFNSVNNILFF